jgi:flagellar biosynthetic protein FliP
MTTREGRTAPLSLSAANRKNMSGFLRLPRQWARRATAAVVSGALLSPLAAQTLPKVTVSVADSQNPGDVAVALQVLFLITILALAPSLLILLTSFVRIVIVFSFLRRALGTQSMPPDQVMVGLALFLTLFIMMPVFTQINDTAIQPYLAEEITFNEGITAAARPVRNFMLRQVNEKDVALFVRIAKTPTPRNIDDLSLDVIVPAFITSELKTAFIIGFVLYIPFLVIDMVVASVLLSMGMMMLPPIMISLPFKIILFVLIDGWHLIVRELVGSFR